MDRQIRVLSIMYVLVLFCLALIDGPGDARAQSPSVCNSYPCFNSFDELAGWKPGSVDPRQIAMVPLAPRTVTSNPGLVVGLDFFGWDFAAKGDGATQGGPVGNLYPFNHWQYVDIAYYYHHGLVSVPPVVWTDAAHRNGVKMLGTVTADFGEGDAAGKLFNALFNSPDHAHTTQLQLEKLARTFGFDGWIIDFERGARANDLVINTIVALKKDGLSVATYREALQSLADSPLGFPDRPDFLKATDAAGAWQSDYLTYNSENPPGNAPERTYQLITRPPGPHLNRWSAYSAVNIYGSEDNSPPCRDGELSNTKVCLNLSNTKETTPLFPTLDAVTNGKPPGGAWTSVGVFAPGWPAYGGSKRFGDMLPPPSEWRPVDDKIWDGKAPTGPSCSTASSGALSHYVAARSVIGSLPFVTRFNRGIGTQYAVEGVTVSSSEWNHFGAQDVLPMWFCRMKGSDSEVGLSYKDGMAWDGGTTLWMHSAKPVLGENEWELWSTAAKLSHPAVRIRYRGSGPKPFVRLSYVDPPVRNSPSIPELSPIEGEMEIEGNEDPGRNWTTTFVEIPSLTGKILTGISVGTSASTTAKIADVEIGEVAVVDSSQLKPPALITPASSSVLTWSAHTIRANVWAVNQKAACLEFLGPAFTNSYQIKAALFPTPDADIRGYRVQPVSAAGVPAVLDLRPCASSSAPAE
jgi:endo-beta-N-acetylglucosaminidase D